MFKHSRLKIIVRILLATALLVFATAQSDYFIDYSRSGLSDFAAENHSNPILHNQSLTAEIRTDSSAKSLQLIMVPPVEKGGEAVTLTLYIKGEETPVLNTVLSEQHIFSQEFTTIALPEELPKGTECILEISSTETDLSQATRVVFGSATKTDVSQWYCGDIAQPGIPAISFVYRTVKTTAVAIAALSLMCIAFSILIIMLGDKNTLLKRLVSLAEPAVAMAMVLLSVYIIEMLQVANILALDKLVILANIIIVLGLALLFNVFINRFISSAALSSIITLLSGIANHYLIVFRGTTLLPSDLLGITTAVKVADSYKFELSIDVICAICVITAAASFLRLGKKENLFSFTNNKAVKYAGKVLTFVLAFTMLVTPAKRPGLFNGEIYLWRQAAASRLTNGFLFNFTMNVPLLVRDKPEGYDVSLLNTYTNLDTVDANRDNTEKTYRKLPNILFVMNESFTDPRTILEIKDSDNLLPNLDGLKTDPKAFVGQTAVSVFGGGTSSSEYEMLTGFSVKTDGANGAPYLTYFHKDTPSIVWYLKNKGYITSSLHFAEGKNWYRDTAYPSVGFDHIIFLDEATGNLEDSTGLFEGEKPVSQNNLSAFVSDKAGYDYLFRLMENYDEPLFNFYITMQNHGAYSDADKQYNYASDDWSVYLKMMNSSDRQLGEFLSALSEFEEPTVVVFFGDHWSYFDENKLLSAGITLDAMTQEQLTDYYSTPYVVWSNCGYDFSSLPQQTSLPYVSSLVMNQLGFELTSWQNYLVNWSEKVPVYTRYNIISNVDETTLAEFEYQMKCLHYNALNDKSGYNRDIFGQVG